MRRDTGKYWKNHVSLGNNAFTNNRPGPGGVVYIQQMLVITTSGFNESEGEPKIENEEATNAMNKVR